jgi:hypothetical protein
MEIAAASVAANALRIGLNIAVGQNRPVIEFYYEVHNNFGPVERVPERVLMGGKYKAPAFEHRRHDIAISIYAVNIGSLRAEEVVFEEDSRFERRGGTWGEIFGNPIRQMAPGQAIYLLKLDQGEFFFGEEHSPKGDLILSVEYRAPKTLLNWVARQWFRIRKRSQYRTEFTFNIKNVATDLPPANYA